MKEGHQTNPVSIYGLTKLWQEQLMQHYAKSQKIDFVIFRIQNAYGPKQTLCNPYTGIIGIFTNLIIQNREIELFEDGGMRRDFVYVEDVAEAIIKGIFFPEALSKIVNIGSGKTVTLYELVKAIAKVAGKEPAIAHSGRFRIGDIRHAIADMSLYKVIFGEYRPTPLEIGLKKYLDWYLEQPPVADGLLQASLKEMEGKGLLRKAK